jgi:hypothetical protein
MSAHDPVVRLLAYAAALDRTSRRRAGERRAVGLWRGPGVSMLSA